MIESVDKFLNAFAASLRDGTFVKMTLGNYKGLDAHLQRIHIRLIETKKARGFFFCTVMTRATRRKITISIMAVRS